MTAPDSSYLPDLDNPDGWRNPYNGGWWSRDWGGGVRNRDWAAFVEAHGLERDRTPAPVRWMVGER
jgi:hypothetical protein